MPRSSESFRFTKASSAAWTLPGKPIEIEGTLLGGSKIDWESYRGKVVLVDFFASFCDPCRAEVPNVLENYRAYHDKGFEVVGVNLDTNPQMCKLYMDQTGFKFPTIFGDAPNAAGWDLPLARKYGITRIPRVILVDQRRQRRFHNGPRRAARRTVGATARPVRSPARSHHQPQRRPVRDSGRRHLA